MDRPHSVFSKQQKKAQACLVEPSLEFGIESLPQHREVLRSTLPVLAGAHHALVWAEREGTRQPLQTEGSKTWQASPKCIAFQPVGLMRNFSDASKKDNVEESSNQAYAWPSEDRHQEGHRKDRRQEGHRKDRH